jgi:hypothetical protein
MDRRLALSATSPHQYEGRSSKYNFRIGFNTTCIIVSSTKSPSFRVSARATRLTAQRPDCGLRSEEWGVGIGELDKTAYGKGPEIDRFGLLSSHSIGSANSSLHPINRLRKVYRERGWGSTALPSNRSKSPGNISRIRGNHTERCAVPCIRKLSKRPTK